MRRESKITDYLKAKGLYIALAVCIVGASAAAWATANKTLESIEKNNQQIVENGVSGEEKPSWSSSSAAEVQKNTPAVEKPSPSSASAPASASPAENVSKPAEVSKPQNQQPGQQTFSYTLPLESTKVLNPWSGDKLVKNQTLNVWRTHGAVDLGGEKGAKVLAIGDGKVVAVSTDALWGGMVQIEHPDGYTSSYCGVQTESTLKAGMTVKAGQTLGTLGDIPAEISMEPHLHLTLSKGGKAVDPAQVLKLPK